MQVAYLLILSIPVTAAALLVARRQYRRHGRLTWAGLFLLCLMLFVPNLMMDLATRYELPSTPLDYLGVFTGVAGLILLLIGVVNFRSARKVFCLDSGGLTFAGAYRWSRNPQYLGWFLFLLGLALTDWSLWCLAALVVVAVSLHLLVLVEEEHLRRVFGAPYQDFCRRVPRYAGWGRLRL